MDRWRLQDSTLWHLGPDGHWCAKIKADDTGEYEWMVELLSKTGGVHAITRCHTLADAKMSAKLHGEMMNE